MIHRSRRWALLVAIGILFCVGAFFAERALVQPDTSRLAIKDSQIILWHDQTVAHAFLSEDEKWRIPVPLDEVDPAYIQALLAWEDRRFYDHAGVDYRALLRATIQNFTGRRRVSGGSTITMQLIRLLHPRPRTMRSKVIEIFEARALERMLSKDEILEAYLRFAPYGRNIEGIEAASLAYFGHRAHALDAGQIAILLSVPQNPTWRYPSHDNVLRLTQARDRIAEHLLTVGALDLGPDAEKLTTKLALEIVDATAIPDHLLPFPRKLYHVARWLQARHPDQPRIYTSIRSDTQAVLTSLAEERREPFERMGIANLSLVVVDHERAEVVGLLGNFDPAADEELARPSARHLPAFDAPRSSGSVLKPFLYARALDEGLLMPSTMMLDVPMTFGTFRPTNYDGQFDGLVRADQSLTRSLNIPFITMLHELGVEEFVVMLRQMGLTTLMEEPRYYGLNAILGGMEVTPLGLAGAFSVFGRQGRYLAPRWFDEAPLNDNVEEGVQIFSPAATHLTGLAMESRDRPDFPHRRRFNPHAVHVRWKTGTSYGNRDAWTAAVGPRYTVVVWVGNLDRQASNALVGSRVALPLAFDLVDALENRNARHAPRPHDVIQVEVCAYSGHLPSAACEHRIKTSAPVESVATARCPYHVHVFVDDESGLALDGTCRHHRAHQRKSALVWPAAVRRHLRSAMTSGSLPAPHPDCQPAHPNATLAIESPPPSMVYRLIPGMAPEEQHIVLRADGTSGQVSWFVNDLFLGSVDVTEDHHWVPIVGEHRIVVVDSAGAHRVRNLRVIGVP